MDLRKRGIGPSTFCNAGVCYFEEAFSAFYSVESFSAGQTPVLVFRATLIFRYIHGVPLPSAIKEAL